MKENLRILANAVQVDATDLEVQFRDLQPYASKHMAASEGRLASAECWRLAIKQTEKNRAAHPCDALSAVVQRLLSWSSSSSDVERAFGQAKALSLPGQSEKEDMRSESDALILKHELGNNDRDKVIRAAMSLWRTFMGRPRSSERSDRIDKNVPRKRRFVCDESAGSSPQTETSFLAKRSRAVDSLQERPACFGPEELLESLTAQQLHEFKVADKKERKAMVEAFLTGSLCPAGEESTVLDEDLINNTEAYMMSVATAQKDTKARKKREEAILKKDPSNLFHLGCAVFAVDEVGLKIPPGAATLAQQPAAADCLVLARLTACPPEIELLAGLCGSCLCGKDFVESKGMRGACVAYVPAMRQKRSVFCTGNFMVANPRFCCHLTYALQNDGCEWKMIEEDDARRIVQSGIAGRMQKLVVFHEDGEEDQRWQYNGRFFFCVCSRKFLSNLRVLASSILFSD